MKIETTPFIMPIDLYIKLWTQRLFRRNWWWIFGLLIAFVVMSFITTDAIYVAVILGFAAIPPLMILLFVMQLTRSEVYLLLSERVAYISDTGIELRYSRGEKQNFPWHCVIGYKITHTYMMLYIADSETPLYLPFTAFDDEKEYVQIERYILQILTV